MKGDIALLEINLTEAEQKKRGDLAKRKPHVAQKLANIAKLEESGEISPIIRLEKSYLCNFQCTHCSAEFYMDRHLKSVHKTEDDRSKMNYDDIRNLSDQADQLGIARFVLTGGEPLVMKDFDRVVEAIDPDKHYIITDTNGWFLDDTRAKHIKSIGVEKVQLSLDSYIEKDHDNFRNKPGAYKRAMRAIDASLNAELNLILATVLVKGRAKTQEFHDLCKFCTEKGIGLYVSYAKPTGSCTEHPEFVITKEDADILRDLEKEYSVFTHMTPSYGSYKGCITVKGIITVTSTNEVTPCPYIDFSMGNLRESSLKEILDRGMRNPWLGPHRPDCLIGEDPQFIKKHMEVTAKYKLLPVPWGEGFSDSDSLTEEGESNRHYFEFGDIEIDNRKIYDNLTFQFSNIETSFEDFNSRVHEIIKSVKNQPNGEELLKSRWVPFISPKLDANFNYFNNFINDYLPKIKSSFEKIDGVHLFKDHIRKSELEKLFITENSKHGKFIAANKEKEIVGIYFPHLNDVNLSLAIEKVTRLPDNFSLSGLIDLTNVLIGTPNLLLRTDGYPPLLWCGGVSLSPEIGVHYEAYGYDLTINRRPHFDTSAEYWTHGITVI